MKTKKKTPKKSTRYCHALIGGLLAVAALFTSKASAADFTTSRFIGKHIATLPTSQLTNVTTSITATGDAGDTVHLQPDSATGIRLQFTGTTAGVTNNLTLIFGILLDDDASATEAINYVTWSVPIEGTNITRAYTNFSLGSPPYLRLKSVGTLTSAYTNGTLYVITKR